MDWTIDWLSLGPAINVLMVLTGLDIIMGLIVGTIHNELASIRTYKGAFKKLGMYVGISVGMCVDLLIVNYQDSIGITMRPPITIGAGTALAFCIHEGISVLEKLDRTGVPLPGFLMVLLKRLKRQTDQGAGIVLPQISINHMSAHDIKVDSDVNGDPLVEKVAARRTERKMDRMIEQTEANSAILKTVADAVAPTATPNNETTVHE